ncbi:MAG TPA: 50S ribosomal protein L1 [archaeon]|nr:50S ribosomal protein L1 [archaeon]
MEIPQENQIDLHKTYKLAEALPLVRNVEKRKFSQSIDIVIVLRGIDTKKPENKFSKDVVLPHGRGKDVSIFVMDENTFGKAEIENLAKDKKAVKKFMQQHEFLLCEPQLMALVGKLLGRYLAPRGKMPKILAPNMNRDQAIRDMKNSVRVKLRDSPMIQVVVGTEAMSDEQLKDNINKVVEEIKKSLPPKSHIKNTYLKLTMGRPIKVII